MYDKKAIFVLAGSFMSLLPLRADIETRPLSADIKQETSSSFTPFAGKVRGNKVRMRAHPSLESAVVRETSTGEIFAVIGEEKEFFLVSPPRGAKGYVFRTFILDNTVEGDRVNIRLMPDIEAPVIGQLHAGEKVNASVCDANNKWLEISLPKSTHFYISKEYIERNGNVELVAEIENRREKASHLFNAAFHFATAEIQKPFDEIALDQINQKFTNLTTDFADLPEIVSKAKEANATIEEVYVQKKIAFLESKADRTMASREIDPVLLAKLTQFGPVSHAPKVETPSTGVAASTTMGQATIKNDPAFTDKMVVWQSFEESLYHLWAAAHEGKTMDDFYQEEVSNATVLSGVVEIYNRPVKNLPGDFVLRTENLPTAFLYSTKVNLNEFVGKKVTLVSTPRPNNNFAFPAYYVLSVE